MKNTALFLLAAAGLLLPACATPFHAPADVAHIALERRSSPIVRVEKAWLSRRDGQLVLHGSVLKRLRADYTGDTHLDVTLFDDAGRVVRSSVEHFEPRRIPQGHRRPATASYAVPLDPLPSSVARIEVRAHEGTH